MSEPTVRMTLAEAEKLAEEACVAAGAGWTAARSLAAAVISAEASGNHTLGISHMFDYLAGLRAGRIDGEAVPEVAYPAPAMIAIDAKRGFAQTGFDRAFETFVTRTSTYGIALLCQRNSYTTGELGYYPKRLAARGLVAFAFTNGPALMTVPGAARRVYCTNPLAFATPRADGPPLLIDQATSNTAFVNIRRAAERGEPIAEGWAVDDNGQATTDAAAAMKGALLTFGGARGANIALMVELMAAGLGGANWSMDAPGLLDGTESPGAGLTVIAIKPDLMDPDFAVRLAGHLDRLSACGVHIPGTAKGTAEERAKEDGIVLSGALAQRLRRAAAGNDPA